MQLCDCVLFPYPRNSTKYFTADFLSARTRTRTDTNPNDTEANAAGRSGNARALCKQRKCGVIHEGEGIWPKLSQKLQEARQLWVTRTLVQKQ